VASISSADDEIGAMIAEPSTRSEGRRHHVEESQTFGMDGAGRRHALRQGYISPYFVTDPDRMEAVLEDPTSARCSKVSAVRDLLPVLEKVMQTGKPLIIVAETSRARHSPPLS